MKLVEPKLNYVLVNGLLTEILSNFHNSLSNFELVQINYANLILSICCWQYKWKETK
jgi:hypothetical protein